MATWKKIALWFFGTLIVTFAGCVALLIHLFADMCATTVVDQVASPNGKLKAVLFQIDCGATTDFNSHVTIVPSNVDTSQKDSLPESFFAADGNHGRAPAGNGGGPEIRLHWQAEDRLELQHHNFVRLIRSETQSEGVTIDYQTFR
jgi:hypothetical protein